MKKLLAIVLVIAMLLSTVPNVFAVNAVETQKPLKLVSLGDSMTNGYGLPGYGGGTGVEDYANVAYANQFAAWLAGYDGEIGADQVVFEGDKGTVEHTRLAMSGMRAEDLHWLLELDYENKYQLELTERTKLWSDINAYRAEKSDYWENTLRGEWNELFDAGDFWTWDRICGDGSKDHWTAYWSIDGILKAGYTDFPSTYTYNPDEWLTNEMGVIAKYYQEHVAEADLITLSIGTGNFGAFLVERVTEVANFNGVPTDVLVYDVDSAISDLDPAVQTQIKKLLENCKQIIAEQGIEVDDGDPNTTTAMEAMSHIMLYAITSYAVHYAGAMEAILELNPDVEIMLIGLMNTLAEAEGVEVDGVSMGQLMELLFTPLNKYITALPTVLKQLPNSAYANATIYYAEAPFVECLVYEYENLIRDPESSVRNRFVQDIVGSNGTGMIWSLFSGMDLAGMRLQPITLQEINYYDGVDDGIKAADGKDSLKTDVERIAFAAENPAKAVSIAVYLAVEDVIIKVSKSKAVDILTFMNVGEILSDSHLFDDVMAEFMANINNVTDEQLKAVAIVVANGVNDTIADMLANPPAEDVVDYEDILVLMDPESTDADKNPVYYKIIAAVAADSGYNLTAAEVDAVLNNSTSATEVYYKLVKTTIDNAPEYKDFKWLTVEDIKAVAENPNGDTATEVYYKLVKATIDTNSTYAAYNWLTVDDIKAIDIAPNGSDAKAVYCKIVSSQSGGVLTEADVAAIMADATTEESKKALAKLVKATIDNTPAYAEYTWLSENDILAIYNNPDKTQVTSLIVSAMNDAKNGVTNGYNEARTTAITVVSGGMGLAKAEAENLVGDGIATAKTEAAKLLSEGLVTAKAACNTAVEAAEMPCMLLGIPNNLSNALQNDDTVSMLLALFGRAMIANGIGAHPSEKGHNALFEAIKKAYINKHTVEDQTEINLGNDPDVLLLKKIYIYLLSNEYIDLEQTLAIVNYIAENLDALQQSDEAAIDMAKYIYETLLYNDKLTDDDKGTIIINIYLILKEDGRFNGISELEIMDKVFAYLDANEYLTTEQVFKIVDYVYVNLESLMQSDEAMVNLVKFVYETLLHTDGLTSEDKGNIISGIYKIIRETGKLDNIEALEIVDELYTYLSGNAYINSEQIFAIVDCVYEALANDGKVTDAEVRAITDFIYFDVLAVSKNRAVTGNLSPAQKVEIIETVYTVLKKHNYLDIAQYPEMAIVENLYFELTDPNAPLVTDEQALAIFDVVVKAYVENEEIGEEQISELTNTIYDILLNDPTVSDETKVAIIGKVLNALEESGIMDESDYEIAPALGVLREIYSELKNAGLLTDEQAMDIVNYLYAFMLSGESLTLEQSVLIIEHIYTVVFEREDLSNEDKVQIVRIVYTILEENGYIDQAIDYADPYYQLAIREILTEENVDLALKYIDGTIAAVKKVQAVSNTLTVSSELVNVKTALDKELEALLKTLNSTRDILANGQLTSIRGTMAALLVLRDEINTHIINITTLADELGVATGLYITDITNAANYYKTLITTITKDVYNWTVANGENFAKEYSEMVKKIVVAVNEINPELAKVVEAYLTETPAEALAIIYTAGDDAVNEFIATAVSTSKDINEIITGISAILQSDANVLIKALQDERTAFVKAEIEIARSKVEELKKKLDEAIEAGALAETIQNYEAMLTVAQADLVALQNRFVTTIFTVIEDVVDPATATMVRKAFDALKRVATTAGSAGTQYGQWFADRFDQMSGDLLVLVITNTKEYGLLAGEIIDQMIWDFIDDMKQAAQDKVDDIVGSIDMSIDLSDAKATLEQLKGIATDIRTQIATIKEYTSDKIDAEVEKLETALAQVESYIEKLETLINDVEDLVNKIDKESNLTLEKVQAVIKQTQELASDAMELVANAKESMELLAQVYEDVLPQVITLLKYVEEGSPADKFFNATGVEVNEFIKTVTSNYKQTRVAMEQATVNIEAIVTEAVRSVIGSTATAIATIKDATKVAAGDIVLNVETAIATVKAEAIKLAQSTDVKIAAAANQILAQIKEFELNYSKYDLITSVTKAETIVNDLMSVLESAKTVKDLNEAQTLLMQAVTALNALSAVAEDIYDISSKDIRNNLNEAIDLAKNMQNIISATAGSIGADAVAAHNASVQAIYTAADATVKAIKTAVAAYEIAIITAADEIITTATNATQNIANELAVAMGIAVNAFETSIDGAEIGVAAIKVAFESALYDTTHGEYDSNCNSYYVAFGNTTYVAELAKALGLDAHQWAQYTLSELDKAAGADLITVNFDNGEFISFVYDQAMAKVAAIINNSVIGQMAHNNPTYGPVLKQILASYGVDLEAEATEIDWTKFDAEVIAAKDEMLTAIESILSKQGVPETYTIDLGPKVMEILNEGLDEPIVTNLKLEFTIPVKSLLIDIAEIAVYGYFDFAAEFPATLDQIREIAPNAQVVVTGITNNIMDMVPSFIKDMVNIDEYNQYIDYVVDALNYHLFAYAAINTNTTFVENDSVEGVLEALTVTSTDHVWSDWYIVKDATNDEVGEERRDCLNEGCEHYETREIPKIVKVDPEYTVPSDLTATYGDTLADIALPEGFTWKDATASVGNAGVNTFIAIYTPEDTIHYNVVEVEITVTVEKADPTYTVPGNLTATYGDTLADIALPEGFTWKDATASVGNAGVNTFVAIYTPEDTANNNVVEVTVTVTVEKADPTYTVPGNLTATYGDTLADIALPEGFTWKDATATVGNAGVNTFVAIYTPEDTANNNTVEVTVTITIEKADSSVTNAPVAMGTLIANGTAQTLVQAGTGIGGTMVYSLSENGPFTATLPVATNAGVYTVYYKVMGDANHNDTAVQSLTITVYPGKITSDEHVVEEGTHIRKIKAGLTVEQLWNNINEKAYVTVYDKDGNVVDNNALVATGMVAKLIVNGQVVDSVTIIVTGDVNGDGKISITDMVSVQHHVLETTLLTDVYLLAADTQNDGRVTMTDFVQIQHHILEMNQIVEN